MNYTLTDWVEDGYYSMLQLGDANGAQLRALLDVRFQELRPAASNPEWLLDRLLHSVQWIDRHLQDLDTPCVVSDGSTFATSRYLWEALYRICMRLHDSDLGKDMDVSWVMELAQQQKAITTNEESEQDAPPNGP
jgi:hypothetical protein